MILTTPRTPFIEHQSLEATHTNPEPCCCCKAINTIVGMNKPSEPPTYGRLAVNQEKVITPLRQDTHYGNVVSYLR